MKDGIYLTTTIDANTGIHQVECIILSAIALHSRRTEKSSHTVLRLRMKLPFVPANLMLAMFIMKAEEALMGIETAVTASSPDELGFLGSSDIGGSEYEGTQLFVRPTEKRGRSETMSSAGWEPQIFQRLLAAWPILMAENLPRPNINLRPTPRAQCPEKDCGRPTLGKLTLCEHPTVITNWGRYFQKCTAPGCPGFFWHDERTPEDKIPEAVRLHFVYRESVSAMREGLTCGRDKCTRQANPPSSQSPSSQLSSSQPISVVPATVANVTTRTYARPLRDDYVRPLLDDHIRRNESNKKIADDRQAADDLKNRMQVILWNRCGESPVRFNLVNSRPGTLVPSAHTIFMECISHSTSIEVLTRLPSSSRPVEWLMQDVTCPILAPSSSRILMRRPFFKDEDCSGIDEELSYFIVTIPSKTVPHETFPLAYMVDMAKGLDLMGNFHNDDDIRNAFAIHFPTCKYVQSTYYRHRRHFKQAKKLDILQTYINYGHTDEGLWVNLVVELSKLPATISAPALSLPLVEPTSPLHTPLVTLPAADSTPDPPVSSAASVAGDDDDWTIRSVQMEWYEEGPDGLETRSTGKEVSMIYLYRDCMSGSRKTIRQMVGDHPTLGTEMTTFAIKSIHLPGQWWSQSGSARMERCRLLAKKFHLSLATRVGLTKKDFDVLPTYLFTSGDVWCVVAQLWKTGVRYSSGGEAAFNHPQAYDALIAFSHFVFHSTDGVLLHVDFNCIWTLPSQVYVVDCQTHASEHDRDGHNYLGNGGQVALDNFTKSHVCNYLCTSLGLVPF
ncbi:uncharacterized protein LACBIDRAFT_333943 [Laccaria bicolor S238N-H82]|uniref:Predicted protein n=1 Tax=Laccaria bicolor (strain S238N-H82 / ATCC MYA-4686) TaxID=486041 RepID=B0DXL2_LACBS|nr:uncharacterized protein LACBIDRAFT_333943 [Laccaria bicolor S238N-H82]EDR00698.1 predicted protein [Laccaria bicolor S238N-H82]|eukprot:XP_001888707.1 predicted protein [Laccaria bicolor S238N-H82]